MAQLLYRSNVTALVGGGLNPKYPLNKVMIWDDRRQRVSGEMTFRSEIKSIRIRLKHVVVALENKLFIYELSCLRLIHSLDTLVNPRGLLSVNTSLETSSIVAFPGETTGQVGIYVCETEEKILVQAF